MPWTMTATLLLFTAFVMHFYVLRDHPKLSHSPWWEISLINTAALGAVMSALAFEDVMPAPGDVVLVRMLHIVQLLLWLRQIQPLIFITVPTLARRRASAPPGMVGPWKLKHHASAVVLSLAVMTAMAGAQIQGGWETGFIISAMLATPVAILNLTAIATTTRAQRNNPAQEANI